VPDAWLRGGISSPNPRCPGTGRLVSISGRSHQLRDDLPGYHQPFRFAFGIGELLAQQLDLTGQLGYPAGDPFRQPIPPPGILLCELGWTQTITSGYCQSSTDTTGKPTATSNDHQLRSAAPTSTSNPPTGPYQPPYQQLQVGTNSLAAARDPRLTTRAISSALPRQRGPRDSIAHRDSTADPAGGPYWCRDQSS